MKYFIVIIYLLPVTVFAQTKKDYEQAVGKFMKFYNSKQSDSIDAMFLTDMRTVTYPNHVWPSSKTEWAHKDFGKMISYKFMGKEYDSEKNAAIAFKVVFTHSTHAMELSLEKDSTQKVYKLGTFRIKTTSPRLDSMLKHTH